MTNKGLKLSEKEKCDVTIGRKEIEEALVGFHYCMVAKVLTGKGIHFLVEKERLCIGERRIFLARFISQKDMFRVIDAEQPWTFKEALVMVAHMAKKGYNCWEPLSLGTLVRIRFNVREPFMRGTFANLTKDEVIWSDFKYKCLPRYCLICGLLGHVTRVCKEKMLGERWMDENEDNKEEKIEERTHMETGWKENVKRGCKRIPLSRNLSLFEELEETSPEKTPRLPRNLYVGTVRVLGDVNNLGE
ncbi:hypothetical protein DVH24_003824 [Malus domestica]|uniref:Uncharacterized protein n=1 Tax=Malus domestica TaxID=3750 RepID=A0A498KCG7_MALDO|nr:hypothetical protein DVH24_003824 [Malus domestica]